MRIEFRRIFLSFLGFLNVIGAMNGQPQLDLDFEKNGDSEIITSTYVPEADEKNSKQAKINFNFSPSVGFGGDYFIEPLDSSFHLRGDHADQPVIIKAGKLPNNQSGTELAL